MSKFQVGDTAVGCYERNGHSEPIYSIVSKVRDDGVIEVVCETPYGTDYLVIDENQACSLNCCHTCAHRLTRLVTGGYCPASYLPI
jgi:hypothetical protein